MTSLATLKRQENRQDFVKKVAHGVRESAKDTVKVNGGIKTTEQLKERLKKGRNVSFNTQRLIDESKTY